MKKYQAILRYIFPVLIIITVSNNSFCNDTTNRVHLRIGYDLIKPLYSFFKDDIYQQEISFDLVTKSKYILPLEIGLSNANFNRNNFDLDISGLYFKTGYNKKILTDNLDLLCMGMRLAYSNYSIDYINAFVNYNYFNIDPIQINPGPSNRQAIWLEVLLNLEVSVLPNISFGWNVRGKLPLYLEKDKYFKPYYIPGYGKNLNSFSLGFNYMVYYTF